jgi:DNA-binding transcriptional ArsR family regulator
MNHLADTFKALSDETRLRVVTLLLEREELCGDRPEGLWMHYSVSPHLSTEQTTVIDALSRAVGAEQKRDLRQRLDDWFTLKDERRTSDGGEDQAETRCQPGVTNIAPIGSAIRFQGCAGRVHDHKAPTMPPEAAHLCEKDTLTLTIGDDVSLSFRWIPSGSFLVGSPGTEEGHEESESPQHRVVIASGFRMSCVPVTRDQWEAVMGPPLARPAQASHPVTEVSWDDAQGFLARLPQVLEQGSVRPTEAEWEYACRAGSSGPYASGDSEADLDRMGWYAANSGGATHPAGEKAPNAWGLQDMHGNVFEWCQDWDGPYAPCEQTDPTGPPSGDKRILRGGCFKCPPPYCRSANRYSAPPHRRGRNFGFRVVLRAAAGLRGSG